jgi:signal transduction histidine kinase
MTSVRSFAEVLLAEKDLAAEKRERFLAIIHEESQRLTRLLDEILDLNRLESREQAMRFAAVEPAKVLREAVAAMSGFAHQRGVELTERLPDALPAIRADADRLKQVTINLIHNAIKFNASESPRVEIRGRLRGGHVVLSVADNGPGIAPTDVEEIFRKFSRRRGGSEGSGLGLAISREIVEAHGGERPGRGLRGRSAGGRSAG